MRLEPVGKKSNFEYLGDEISDEELCVVNLWPDDEFLGHFYLKIFKTAEENEEEEEQIFNYSVVKNDIEIFSDTILFSDKDRFSLVFAPKTSSKFSTNITFKRIDIFEGHECWQCID